MILLRFFFVGFFILAVQINVSFVSNYVVKLIGLLFLLGGIWEMSPKSEQYKFLFKPLVGLSFTSLVSAMFFLVINHFSLSKISMQIIQVAVGSLLAILILFTQKRIMNCMSEDGELEFVKYEINELQKSWSKYSYFVFAGVVFNILNIVQIDMIKNISALAMAISRIIMYVFALIMIWKFIKILIKCNKNIE